MVFESIANVYGSQYQEKLLNRRVLSTKPDDNGNIDLTWAGVSDEDELGVELFYADKSGEVYAEYYPKLGTALRLENVDYVHGLTYRTLYKPSSAAIDTFYTGIAKIPIRRTFNVALRKPVTASDVLTPTNTAQWGENAVDGNIATSSGRWVSTASGEHTLEIDLQGEYTISNYKFWNGNGDYIGLPLETFKLQAWVNDAWVDAHVSDSAHSGPFSADFLPVTTSKVRFVTTSQTRIYEIEVYTVIEY